MKTGKMIDLILVAVGLGMGAASAVLNILNVSTAVVPTLLGIGMFCLAAVMLDKVAK